MTGYVCRITLMTPIDSWRTVEQVCHWCWYAWMWGTLIGQVSACLAALEPQESSTRPSPNKEICMHWSSYLVVCMFYCNLSAMPECWRNGCSATERSSGQNECSFFDILSETVLSAGSVGSSPYWSTAVTWSYCIPWGWDPCNPEGPCVHKLAIVLPDSVVNSDFAGTLHYGYNSWRGQQGFEAGLGPRGPVSEKRGAHTLNERGTNTTLNRHIAEFIVSGCSVWRETSVASTSISNAIWSK